MAKRSRRGGADRAFVLQKVQPALLGLMDGSVSTLAPLFAAAGLTGDSHKAFFVSKDRPVGRGASAGGTDAPAASPAPLV